MSISTSDHLGTDLGNAFLSAVQGLGSADNGLSSSLCLKTLLDNLRDGIVFVDAEGKIGTWNQAVEIMTGMSSSRMVGLTFEPGLLNLSDANGIEVFPGDCPLQECLQTGKKKSGEYRIVGRSGRETKVEFSFSPIRSTDEKLAGAMMLLHDASVQMDLKRQLKDLYEFSMVDPLTQVNNRAEFERVLDQYVRANHTSEFKCSLIICDIDFFKSINDNFNHHIGDQALISFASLLKKFVRAQDIVARYGGEEFVILCGDCDRESAVERAEEIRVTLTKTPQQMLNGKCITASFGVAELQQCDTATEFFIRADTALLKAKELGRNRVVEADSASKPNVKAASETSLSGVQWRNLKSANLICEEFVSSTPLSVLVEKLRGFIIESEADIRRVEPDYANLLLQIDDENNPARKANFIIDIEFQEHETSADKSRLVGNRTQTFIRVIIREGKKKWFSMNANDLASVVLRDIRRYLMISDDNAKLKISPVATKSTRDSH